MVAQETATYELKASGGAPAGGEAVGAGGTLPESLLRENELWSCRFRWMVVAVFLTFGALSFLPSLFRPLGLRPYQYWPFGVAVLAAVANVIFLWHAGQFNHSGEQGPPAVNLWAQIGVDLVLLTGVVHYVGSVETYISFAYLFHIILACIFFSRRKSLLVTVAAAALYLACVELERLQVISSAGIYLGDNIRQAIQQQPLGVHLSVFSAIAVWFVVWYLASALSAMLRQRERELEETNTRLEQAQRERTRHMLRTTHELKSPFTAIKANTQLLLGGYCGELPDKALDVCERIAARSDRLSREIQEMLQLANLSSESGDAPEKQVVDLSETADWAVEQVRNIADEREVSIETDLQEAEVSGTEEQLRMLFQNLLSNAVNYSTEGGTVRVEVQGGDSPGPTAVVQDDGIGIDQEKLPHIFDEYYRTNEAVKHHKESTGLGLAIVRQVAEEHGAGIKVRSAPGEGTSFELTFPPAGKPDNHGNTREE